MAKDKRDPEVKKCPWCFAKEVDTVRLHWDEKEQEYYCTKCIYVGTGRQVDRFFQAIQEHKYRVI